MYACVLGRWLDHLQEVNESTLHLNPGRLTNCWWIFFWWICWWIYFSGISLKRVADWFLEWIRSVCIIVTRPHSPISTLFQVPHSLEMLTISTPSFPTIPLCTKSTPIAALLAPEIQRGYSDVAAKNGECILWQHKSNSATGICNYATELDHTSRWKNTILYTIIYLEVN